jgi:tetratricopeptide (TPR) repeat protein
MLSTNAQDKTGKGDKLDYLISLHEKNPAAVGYIIPIAKYYKNREMFIESIEWLNKAADIQPENTDILFEIGLLMSWTDKYGPAIEYFDRILKIAPGHDDAKLAKARVLSWQDKRTEALSLCEEVITHNPEYIDAYQLKARILTWEKKYDEATDVYSQILNIESKNKNASMGLVNIISFQGNYEEAVSRYKSLLNQYPGDIAIMNALGKVLLWQGKYEEGISVLKDSFALDERRTETIELLSRAYLWSKKFEEGIEFQMKINERDKDNFQAVYNIASLYEAMGKYDEAISWYEKALNLKGDDPQLNAKLGLLYSRTSKINQAVTSLQKSLKIRKNDVENLINLGRVYSWQLKIDESIELYNKALRIDPLNQDAYIGLGRAYFYDGQWDLAKEQFSKALEINPLNKEAFSEIARLRSLMMPSLITSYNYFTSRNYSQDSGDLSGKTERHEFSETFSHNFTSWLSSEPQYRQIHEKSYEDGDRLYAIKVDEYSGYLSSKLNKFLQLRGKLVAGRYEAESDFYTLKNRDLISGFVFLDYIMDKWDMNAGFVREPLFPVYKGDEIWIEHTNSYVSSVRYNQTEYLSFFTSFYYKKDYAAYKRNDYWVGFDYILPQFNKIEFEYFFRQITNPQDNMHSATIMYTDDFDKLNLFSSYNLEDSSLFDEITQTIELFFYYDVKDNVSANAGVTHSKNLKSDKDEALEINAYVSYRF